MMKFTRFLTAYAVAAALLAMAGGCDNRGAAEAGDAAGGYRRAEAFRDPGETTDVARINELQIASGARTDATLRPYHFDEAELNSLGFEKLDHMAGGAPRTGALVVYLDVPTDGDQQALAAARRKAVMGYLSGRGLADGAFRVESGHNPRATVPVSSVEPKAGVSTVPAPAPAPSSFGESDSGGGFGEPK